MTDSTDAPHRGARSHASAWHSQIRWNQTHPEARRAHYQVRKARKAGTLTPKGCEWPGCADPKVEAHHPDYRHPLKVKWLCRFHHRAEHKRILCEAMP